MNREVALFKPEQMLNYAEEILASDNPDKEQSILQTMFEYITRTKLKWEILLERLLYQFLDLSFQLRKQYLIKEVLKAYRMLTQSQYTDSLKSVLEYYRNKRLELIIREIQKRPLQEIIDIEDIENEQSPEDLLISSFRIDQKRQRDQLKNNMRIVWDGYKSIIETVKINQRLEDFYIETLQIPFNFAEKYNRKHEFKRYCDTIRTGLQHIFKTKSERTEMQKAIYIDIENIEVNERNVIVRLEQFEVATKLGLWQESFQVLEDINTLMKARKGTVKKSTMARYYLNLSKLFKKSNYWNYHAFTYFNYYETYRRNPNLKHEDINNMIDQLLLSVMCIPPFSIERNQNEQSQHKICSLVTSTNYMPNKSELYKLVLERGILESASEHIKKAMGVSVRLIQDIRDAVRASSHSEFASLIEDVIIYKELIEINKIYSKVKLENILKMIPFDRQRIIAILLRTKEQEILQFEFDEFNNIIIFKQKELDTDPYLILKKLARDVAFIAERVRKPKRDEIARYAQLFLDDAKELYFRIRPFKSQQFREKLKQPMKELRNSEMERERKEIEQRDKIERQRKYQQNQLRRRQIIHQKQLITKKDKIKDIVKIKGNRVVKTLGKKIETLDDADLEDLTVDALDALYKETEQKNKQDAQNKYKKAFLKVDYLERARRQNMAPILEADWAEANKQIGDIQQSLRETFQQQRMRKVKLLPAKDYIEKQLETQTQKRRDQYVSAVEQYRKRITFEYKDRILARAKELLDEEIKRNKQIQLDYQKRQLEAVKSQTIEDDTNWRVRATQPATTDASKAVTANSKQLSASNPFDFRNRVPQPSVPGAATSATTALNAPSFINKNNPTTTTTVVQEDNWRTMHKTEQKGVNPLFKNTAVTSNNPVAPPGTGFNFRDKKEQPKQAPKKQQPKKDDGFWRKAN